MAAVDAAGMTLSALGAACATTGAGGALDEAGSSQAAFLASVSAISKHLIAAVTLLAKAKAEAAAAKR